MECVNSKFADYFAKEKKKKICTGNIWHDILNQSKKLLCEKYSKDVNRRGKHFGLANVVHLFLMSQGNYAVQLLFFIVIFKFSTIIILCIVLRCEIVLFF